MKETILLGKGPDIIEVPRAVWEDRLRAHQHATTYHERFPFMTDEHQRVRYFVVRELARSAKPLEPRFIAEKLALPLDRLAGILDDLEKNLVFLVRDAEGYVSWAFPITTNQTSHRLRFNGGEEIYAA